MTIAPTATESETDIDRLRRLIKDVAPAPLITTPGSDSPATQSTASAAGASAGAIVVILIWLLSLTHITVPGEVQVALTVLVGSGVHWAMITFGMDKPNTPVGTSK